MKSNLITSDIKLVSYSSNFNKSNILQYIFRPFRILNVFHKTNNIRKVIIIIIIIIILLIFIQGIYNFTPEINDVSRVHSVAEVLYLQFVLHVVLFRPVKCVLRYISAFRSLCVQYPVRLFL